MIDPQAYAVCMFDLHKGELWTKAVGHAGGDGVTLCGCRVRFNRQSKKSSWRRADYRDHVSCNRCRKILKLEPWTSEPRDY
jgi:hypothetical protein